MQVQTFVYIEQFCRFCLLHHWILFAIPMLPTFFPFVYNTACFSSNVLEFVCLLLDERVNISLILVFHGNLMTPSYS